MENTQLTPEQEKEQRIIARVQARKEAIERNVQRKVFPIIIPHPQGEDGVVLGFAYEPDLTTQLRLMDRGQEFKNGISIEECSRALEALIIPGETDPVILDKTGTAVYWKGAAFSLGEYTNLAIPVIKKK